MKRKIDCDEEEESGQGDSTSSDEGSASEEPRINDVLNNLSQAVHRQLFRSWRASSHSAVCRGIIRSQMAARFTTGSKIVTGLTAGQMYR